MFEVLQSKMDDINASDIVSRLGLKENNYFVVSAHREENINSDTNFADLVESLNAVAAHYNMPIIISTHPRTMQMIKQKGIRLHPLIQTLKPMGFIDYVKLQMKSKQSLAIVA